ncbi:MAG TPA: Vms1/Ankzf1 family peptidyl-tRNA hydrolase, partial [Methanotrichaceae archaeon]|nr:Vms1/Ankzf1 family peptidyl-tRNA hydrolase [Methanotrichaceae archaeon]
LMPTTKPIISEPASKFLKASTLSSKSSMHVKADKEALGKNPQVTSLTDIDLHALAEVKDEHDTFLTVYFGTAGRDRDQSFVASRLSAIQKALPKDLKVAFEEALDMVEHALSAPAVKGERGRIIFASAHSGFMQIYRLSVEPETLVVLDSSPFILPLAKLREEFQDYGLLLIDSQEARLFLVKSDLLEENEKASIDLMNKHKKGGWSQMRYNRLRRGQIHSFFTQLIDDLQKNEDLTRMRGLVVAGPGEAKGQLIEMMPPALKDKVIGTVDTSMEAASRDLARQGKDRAHEDERSREKVLAEKLKEAVLRGHPAAYGLSEVGTALKEGRVNCLLITKGFALPGMICKSCHHIDSEIEKCPTCGSEAAALSLESLYELAENMGTDVVLVEDDAFLESIGNLGAILRY